MAGTQSAVREQTQGQTCGKSGKVNGRGRSGRSKPSGESMHVQAFDSSGPRKYAIQVWKAGNGNPCLKIIEGIPNGDDGTFRKFNVTIWSEDFEKFWAALDEVRQYIAENDIRTPPGHKYEPGRRKRSGRSRTGNQGSTSRS